MVDFFTSFFNGIPPYEAAVMLLFALLAAVSAYQRFITRCPYCGSRLITLDGKNNLVYRKTKPREERGDQYLNPPMEEGTFYRCKKCHFETTSLFNLDE